MSDNLPGRQPKILLIIFGVILVLLLAEGVFLISVRNKNKGSKVENQKKFEIAEEKITPVSTGGIEKKVESSWEGKKTTLVKGKVSSFDVNNQKIDLILEDNTTSRTVEIDDKTIFLSIESGEKQVSPSPPKSMDISAFWKELKEGETINASCYDNGTAAFVTKIVNYKNPD